MNLHYCKWYLVTLILKHYGAMSICYLCISTLTDQEVSIAEESLGLSAFLSFSTNIRSIQEGLVTFCGHSEGR